MNRQAEREQFLRQPHLAVLATIDADGRPHAMPIWYLYEGGLFLMSAGRNSRKHRNVARNPLATLVIDQRTLPYRAVMVQGTVEIGPRLDLDARLRLAKRYLGDEQGQVYVESHPDEDSITLRLRPERVVEYHGVNAGAGNS